MTPEENDLFDGNMQRSEYRKVFSSSDSASYENIANTDLRVSVIISKAGPVAITFSELMAKSFTPVGKAKLQALNKELRELFGSRLTVKVGQNEVAN